MGRGDPVLDAPRSPLQPTPSVAKQWAHWTQPSLGDAGPDSMVRGAG